LVASFKSCEKDKNRRFLNAYLDLETKRLDDKKQIEDPYVSLARDSLSYFVKNRKRMAIPEDTDTKMLTTKAGVFVSLKKDHQLRGCIGTTAPTTPSVAHEIIKNAILAGSEDPRFSPVELSELPFLEVSVEVLMEAQPIESTALLNPKIYGIIVQSGHKSGLLLPNLEGVDTVEEQLSIVLRKAHIHPSEPYTMQRFEVIRHD
jgi:AmmeMemoRadiSam system protein A